jgi:hypothetical protein
MGGSHWERATWRHLRRGSEESDKWEGKLLEMRLEAQQGPGPVEAWRPSQGLWLSEKRDRL